MAVDRRTLGQGMPTARRHGVTSETYLMLLVAVMDSERVSSR